MKRLAFLLSVVTILALAQAPKKAAPKAAPKAEQKAAAVAEEVFTEREPGTYAIFHTSMGDIVCKLFPKEAPKTVANFIGLAEGTKDWTDPASGVKKTKTPLYSGTVFHRVIPNFMIQGGDPLGTGSGNPGYKFEDEFVPTLKFDVPGRLAMANSGPGTNGSQFFITEVPTPHLDMHHTIFGQVIDGQELVGKIARTSDRVKLVRVAIQRVKEK